MPLWDFFFFLEALVKISDCLNSGVREGRPDVLNTPAHPVKLRIYTEGIRW